MPWLGGFPQTQATGLGPPWPASSCQHIVHLITQLGVISFHHPVMFAAGTFVVFPEFPMFHHFPYTTEATNMFGSPEVVESGESRKCILNCIPVDGVKVPRKKSLVLVQFSLMIGPKDTTLDRCRGIARLFDAVHITLPTFIV